MTIAIETQDLTKVYPGGILAVDRVTFQVPRGEIFGFLGPNGAGKSTTILMLATLLRPTGGRAVVAGWDAVRHPLRLRQAIGYVSQDLAVDDNLTGRENLYLQAKWYGLSQQEIRERLTEILAMVNLTDRADDRVETYSGGMRKRLDIAEGLIHRPQVLFLDEPTLGLDIQTRAEIWKYVAHLREAFGMTIFLTTHYMEEADRLCDRIGIIDRGVLKALDSPDRLKQQLGGGVITLALAGPGPEVDRAATAIAGLPGVRGVKAQDGRHVVLADHGEALLPLLFAALKPLPIALHSLTLTQPTLDDVYLHHTGRALRDEVEGSKEEAARQRIVMRRTRR
ncbi:MAG: ATP-binding cassette domain-containing protein [candidate division FCPU426 bacterium]